MTEAIKKLLPYIQDHKIFLNHDFRLVGGTALSYHLDHRISEDLDFCLTKELPLDDIQSFIEYCTDTFGIANIEYIDPSRAIMEDFLIGGDNVEYYLQTWMINGVKIQFFDGAPNLGTKDFFEIDEYQKIGNIKVASLDTIFKMKSMMFYKRTKSRDLFDMLTMYALIDNRYTPEATKKLIMQYDALYFNEKYFYSLWIESFKNKTYLKERDEGLSGLTNDPKTYEQMRSALVEMLTA